MFVTVNKFITNKAEFKFVNKNTFSAFPCPQPLHTLIQRADRMFPELSR